MIRSLTLIALLCLFGAGAIQAQPLCGFDAAHQAKLLQDPAYAVKVQQDVNRWIQTQQSSQNSLIVQTANGPVYEIPLVIHVIHTGGAVGTIYNPTDAQLTGMVNYLNATYAAQWANYPSATTGGTAFPVKFVLAKRDTACGSTTGINRVNGSSLSGYTSGGVAHNSSTGASESAVKALSRWPNTDYYNIWVVNKIDGQDGTSGTFVAGYAYFPGAGDLDGTIMLATTAVAGEITLPHEIGHAFSLYHTFEGDQGGTVCPPNPSTATNGDLVADTDPHIRSVFNCPTGTNACTGAAYGTVVHNFMDYSNCQDRFTVGQRTRWLDGLLNSRASLISSLGGTAISSSAPSVACAVSNTLSGPSSFYTTVDAGPAEVTFADMTATTQGGYQSDGNRAYLDRTCLQQANLVVGNTYPLTVKVKENIVGGNNHKVRVWIDLNNDGVFGTTELIYTANNSNGGTLASGYTYSGNYTIPATATTCVPLRMRVIADRNTATNISACGPLYSGQAEDYIVVIKPTPPTVSVALAPGSANPSCSGTSLTFNASVPTGVTPTGYKWYINGAQQTATTASFTTSAPVNGSTVRVRVFYSNSCGSDSALSADFTVQRNATVAPTVSIAVTGGSNPGCAGQLLTFTATGTNTGTAPTYQWRVNGNVVATGASATYSSSTLTANDAVTVTLVSNSSCAVPTSVTSASITVIFSAVYPDVTIAQTAGSVPACAGRPISITATPINGGTAPVYEWQVNGVTAAGNTSAVFTYIPQPGDAVVAVLTSNNPCVTIAKDTSSPLVIPVTPADTAKAEIALTSGQNPGCKDSLVGFTALIQNMGSPLISWRVNGIQVATGTTFSSTTLQNGDVLTVRAIATGAGCRDRDTVTTAGITLVRASAPPAPAISYIAGNLVANTTNVQWYGPNGLIAGATSQTYHPQVPGQYYVKAISNNCPSLPSNRLQISPLSVGTLDMTGISVFPNPTTGDIAIDWGTPVSQASVDVYSGLGQHLMSEKVVAQSRHTLDLSKYPSGTYFLIIRNAAGEAGTVPVTVKH